MGINNSSLKSVEVPTFGQLLVQVTKIRYPSYTKLSAQEKHQLRQVVLRDLQLKAKAKILRDQRTLGRNIDFVVAEDMQEELGVPLQPVEGESKPFVEKPKTSRFKRWRAQRLRNRIEELEALNAIFRNQQQSQENNDPAPSDVGTGEAQEVHNEVVQQNRFQRWLNTKDDEGRTRLQRFQGITGRLNFIANTIRLSSSIIDTVRVFVTWVASWWMSPGYLEFFDRTLARFSVESQMNQRLFANFMGELRSDPRYALYALTVMTLYRRNRSLPGYGTIVTAVHQFVVREELSIDITSLRTWADGPGPQICCTWFDFEGNAPIYILRAEVYSEILKIKGRQLVVAAVDWVASLPFVRPVVEALLLPIAAQQALFRLTNVVSPPVNFEDPTTFEDFSRWLDLNLLDVRQMTVHYSRRDYGSVRRNNRQAWVFAEETPEESEESSSSQLVARR